MFGCQQCCIACYTSLMVCMIFFGGNLKKRQWKIRLFDLWYWKYSLVNSNVFLVFPIFHWVLRAKEANYSSLDCCVTRANSIYRGSWWKLSPSLNNFLLPLIIWLMNWRSKLPPVQFSLGWELCLFPSHQFGRLLHFLSLILFLLIFHGSLAQKLLSILLWHWIYFFFLVMENQYS